MQFTIAAVAAALVATVSAHSNVTWVTEVHTSFTTYCPGPTTLTFNDVTYTITEATTFTITDCPCTISKPVSVTPVVYCNTCTVAPSAPVYVNSTLPGVTPPAPVVPTTTANPVGTVTPEATQPVFTGAANRAAAGSAAGLAGLLGLAAYIL